jgi:hypothetical protein
MATAPTVVQEQEAVTFYCWVGNTPSSQIIHISGGERKVDRGGEIIRTVDKNAQFHNGMFSTTDPEVITILRNMCKPGSGITEDREVFYSATMNKDQQVRRAAAKASQLEGDLAKEKEENSRLRKLLEKSGGRKE